MEDKEILRRTQISLTKEILILQTELIKALGINYKKPTSIGQLAIVHLKLKLKDLQGEIDRIKECQ